MDNQNLGMEGMRSGVPEADARAGDRMAIREQALASPGWRDQDPTFHPGPWSENPDPPAHRTTSTCPWPGLLLGAVLAVLAATGVRAQEITVSGAATGEVDVYVAEEGDTLWDICDRFFNDPWYWPVLWSFNPHITNPNWIFPGDLVYLVPPKPKPPEREGYRVTEARYSVGPQWEQVVARRVGFVSKEEFEGSGEVRYSREEKALLSQTDEVYVEFQTARRVKAGDLYLLYRVEEEVEHPVTGKDLGYKVRYLGVVRVTSTDTEENRAVILRSFEEVHRGDRVAPFAPVARIVPPVRNTSAVSGNIVATFDDVGMLGEYHYVVLDRGEDHGVAAGNRFLVRLRGDGREEVDEDDLDRFPYETYGEVIVIETQPATCVGAVTYALRELAVGDPCDMLAGY